MILYCDFIYTAMYKTKRKIPRSDKIFFCANLISREKKNGSCSNRFVDCTDSGNT